ncbi:AI-2E family transporter [Bradyrhizobium sp. AUGA SZCCT0240]|uniref:AI-2E family transporter n=1 Tax=unclassified Bradyrhizobium TaxID=2631580 RepID=UPI001BAC525D|nr:MULTISPECIES: AI-2E family transporter [unclassified Bradyrhizobium]MBR1198262.1 AI-2E family transporter [Bradyrhizobium sp. AUGA SZCCT0158]MBR1238907.1 AI-2E family transporter [Bradyrhizobium sp. AUGA SZCCT0274]MBR1255721.1 AI-2E family transporter [Bradyrhizobium sp. AUGA SZCCT0240]
MKFAVGIIAVVLLAAAVRQATAVFAPLALALFIIAIVWPLQSRLQAKMPKLLALALTIVVTIVVCLAFASLAAWGFGRVGRSLMADTVRYQALYGAMVTWLDGHGVSVAGLWAEHFNVTWLMRTTQFVTGRVNTTLSFWVIALVYVVLGLLEVEDARRRIETLGKPEVARVLLDGSAATAAKFRKYLLVRTQMSAITGLLVGVFAWITGLPFALEWGVIAFALNYIPFIGPFIATLFPTLLAMTQFESWQAVLALFACLNIIQFVVGSYVEPRVAGSMLAISPLVVLFAIFFWTFQWGLFGTFIGVPIALAILTFCAQHPSSRWIADLLGGSKQLSVEKS